MGYNDAMQSYNVPVYSLQLVRHAPPTGKYLTSADKVVEVLKPMMESSDREQVVMVALDAKLQIIGVMQVAVGTIDASLFANREIIKAALLVNAASIIVAHNHPSGDPEPSPEDVKVTKSLSEACKLMDVPLIDHIVFGYDSHVSLKAKGVL